MIWHDMTWYMIYDISDIYLIYIYVYLYTYFRTLIRNSGTFVRRISEFESESPHQLGGRHSGHSRPAQAPVTPGSSAGWLWWKTSEWLGYMWGYMWGFYRDFHLWMIGMMGIYDDICGDICGDFIGICLTKNIYMVQWSSELFFMEIMNESHHGIGSMLASESLLIPWK